MRDMQTPRRAESPKEKIRPRGIRKLGLELRDFLTDLVENRPYVVPVEADRAGALLELHGLHKRRQRPGHLESYLRNANLDAKTPHTLTTPDELRAEIEKVRAQGFAVDNEEFLEGVIAFAVPLRDKNGRMPATIAFQGPTQRISIEAGFAHLPRLKRAAEELSALL